MPNLVLSTQRTITWVKAVALSVAVWVMAGVLPQVCPAQTMSGSSLAGVSGGISLSVDCMWFDAPGWRPVRVHVRAVTPTPADRVFSLELTGSVLYSSNNSSIRIAQDIVLPGGATEASAVLTLPTHFPVGVIDLDVWQDGVFKKKLSHQSMGFGNFSWNGWNTGSQVCVLVLGEGPSAGMPNVSSLLYAGSANYNYGPAQFGGGTGYHVLDPSGILYLDLLATGSTPLILPDRWQHFSCVDVVITKAEVLAKLRGSSPQTWEALRQWVQLGGNLWVSGFDANWSGLQSFMQALDVKTSADPAGPDTANDPAALGWVAADSTKKLTQLPAGYSQASAGYYYAQSVSTPVPEQVAVEDTTQFIHRPLGQGTVMAFNNPDVNAISSSTFSWAMNSTDLQRYKWENRNGVSATQPNPDFWEFMIQGVGLPPVNSFRVMITVFAVLVGPVAYLWLKRKKKLHLMLFGVPLVATLLTVGLFGYAVMVDGLAVRTRTRAFTSLDQSRGEAATWGRVSYYAGLAPSDGMTLPKDMFLYPFDAEGWSMYAGASRQHSLRAGDENNYLVSGWLSSRTRHQYIAQRFRKTSIQLEIRQTTTAGAEVQNRLGSKILQVVLMDEAGNLHLGQDIPQDAVAQLKPCLPEEAGTFLEAAIAAQKLSIPPEMQEGALGDFMGVSNTTRFNLGGTNSFASTPLEKGISKFTTFRTTKSLGLVARSYVAITEDSVELELGVEDPTDEGSLNIIYGQW